MRVTSFARMVSRVEGGRVNLTIAQIVPMVEKALAVIQDGALEKLVNSGAIDALVKAKAASNGKN